MAVPNPSCRVACDCCPPGYEDIVGSIGLDGVSTPDGSYGSIDCGADPYPFATLWSCGDQTWDLPYGPVCQIRQRCVGGEFVFDYLSYATDGQWVATDAFVDCPVCDPENPNAPAEGYIRFDIRAGCTTSGGDHFFDVTVEFFLEGPCGNPSL